MDTGHFTRAHEILQYTVGLDHDMFAVVDFYLLAAYRINEGQFGQTTVIQLRQRRKDLLEGRFLDEHRMEDTVLGIRIRVLLDTAAGERPVTDVHREEQVVHRLFAIYRQNHVLRLMLRDGTD